MAWLTPFTFTTWTEPKTFDAGTGLTADDLNIYLRDNFNQTAPAKATEQGGWFMVSDLHQISERRPYGEYVGTTRTTTSTVYTDLTGTDGTGPSVTVTTGTTALIILSTQCKNNTAGGQCLMSHEVVGEGGETLVATDNAAILGESAAAGQSFSGSHWVIRSGITPGRNTFSAKYRVNAGTGTWFRRRILVLPL